MTNAQRLDSILTGIKDGAPTNGTILKVADAFVTILTDTEILQRYGVSRAALTNAQKTEIVVAAFRGFVKSVVESAPRVLATRTVTPPGDSADL